MRLLLIEDELKVADVIVRGLRAERFAVDVAHDGITGWQMASSVEYDLIILDLMLPGLSGTEVLKRLQRAGGSAAVRMPAWSATGAMVAMACPVRRALR